MREAVVTVPELGMIAATRVALGAGAGLLLAGWFNREMRHKAGWTLLAVGALTTLPLALHVAFGCQKSSRSPSPKRRRPKVAA